MSYLDIYDINGSREFTKKEKMIMAGGLLFTLVVVALIIYFTIFQKDDEIYEIADTTIVQPATDVVQPVVDTTVVQPVVDTTVVQPVADVVQPVADVVQPVASEVISSTETQNALSTGSQFNNKELFTNDLPYQLNNESVSYSQDNDYNEVLKNMALDRGVISQHNQYVNDRNKVTSTASFAPARSDTQDIVTTWGFTKPKYINIDASARNVPSQSPEQGSKPITLRWG